jgi:hypothetical protein
VDKKQIIKDLVAQKDTRCFGDFYKLFNVLLQEARESNDIAPLEEVPKLQGEIRVLKKILKDITPIARKIVHYDGGYGV